MSFNVGMPFMKTSLHPAPRQKHGEGLRKSPKTAYAGNIWDEMCEDRIGRDRDIVPELTAENIWIVGKPMTKNKLLQESHIHINQDNANRKSHGLRSQRFDCVDTIAGIFKPPIEITSNPDFNAEAFYMDCINSLQQLIVDPEDSGTSYRCGEITHAVIHQDEVIGNLREDEFDWVNTIDNDTGEVTQKRQIKDDMRDQIRKRMSPHCHYTIVPWIWETDKDGNKFKTLNAKKFFNTTFLNRVNREMPELLRQRGWDVKDCIMTEDIKDDIEKKKAKQKSAGKDAIEYKAQADRELERTKEQLKQAEEQIEVLESKNKALENELESKEQYINELEIRQARVEEKIEEAKEIINEIDNFQETKAADAISNFFNGLKEFLDKLKKENKKTNAVSISITALENLEKALKPFIKLKEKIKEVVDEFNSLNNLIRRADDRKLEKDNQNEPIISKEKEPER